jgi:hypothetical protein
MMEGQWRTMASTMWMKDDSHEQFSSETWRKIYQELDNCDFPSFSRLSKSFQIDISMDKIVHFPSM